MHIYVFIFNIILETESADFGGGVVIVGVDAEYILYASECIESNGMYMHFFSLIVRRIIIQSVDHTASCGLLLRQKIKKPQ
jgi:hypothetical protein